MISITKKLEFDAGHRVMNHESKCATMHGHRYVAEITATADRLDDIGRVIDFSVVKQKVGGWLDLFWDHTCIVFDADEKTIQGLNGIPSYKPIFVSSFNPTAENMAHFLLKEVCPKELLGTGVRVVKVKLWETPTCFAEASE